MRYLHAAVRVAILVSLMVVCVAQGGTCPDCPDPSRPWMRGSIEKHCGVTQAQVDAMKKAMPEKADRILLCACHHTCDPLNDRADETGGLMWDAACEARCNPANCACDTDCES